VGQGKTITGVYTTTMNGLIHKRF